MDTNLYNQPDQVLPDQSIPQDQSELIVPPYEDRSHPKLIEWQLDPKEILVSISHVLRGERMNSDGVYERVVKKRLMNDEGVNQLLLWLEPRVSRVITLSTYTEEDINGRMYEFEVELAAWIVRKQVEYEIDKPSRDMIHSLISDLVEAALNRAKDGEEKKFLKGTYHLGETYGERTGSAPQRKRSVFAKLSDALSHM